MRTGNIDPQHSRSDSKIAAIEAAAGWPEVPSPGANLVTIRSDLDALGAMAVLTYRAEGRMLTPPMKARIQTVARADRFDRGAWPGPRPSPRSPDELFEDVGGSEAGMMSAGVRIDPCTFRNVYILCSIGWLPGGFQTHTGARRRNGRAWLFRAMQNGGVLLDSSLAPGRMTEIVSEAEGVLAIAYRVAPVVLALKSAFRISGRRHGRQIHCRSIRAGIRGPRRRRFGYRFAGK